MARSRQEPPADARREPLDLHGYLAESRRVSVSLVLVAPLFVFYELALRVAGSDLRNSAEMAVKKLFWYLGPGAAYVHAFLVLVILAAGHRVVVRRIPIHRLLLPFLVECCLLAVLLGPVVAGLADILPLFARSGPEHPPLGWSLLASLGAGLYEELVFRLILLGGLYMLLRHLMRLRRGLSLAVALLVSALLFSGYHHLGPFGEPFDGRAFAFRAAAGILLGLVFAWRGLGVVVYLHAIYDVLYDLRQAAWLE
jgi:membrane protease YdiL (CAAX protease family)